MKRFKNLKFYALECHRVEYCLWCNKPIPEGWQDFCSMKCWTEAGKPDINK